MSTDPIVKGKVVPAGKDCDASELFALLSEDSEFTEELVREFRKLVREEEQRTSIPPGLERP